jgi:hypothetical protein
MFFFFFSEIPCISMVGKTGDEDPAYSVRVSNDLVPSCTKSLTEEGSGNCDYRNDDKYPTPCRQSILSSQRFQ